MKTNLLWIVVLLSLCGLAAVAEDAPPARTAETEGQPPAEDPGPQPAPPVAETEPAPLVKAGRILPKTIFQIGADGGGLSMGGADGVAGVNVTFTWPALDWLGVGFRVQLHYVFAPDTLYDVGWAHFSPHLQFTLLDDPVRVYALVGGGYAFACDVDLYGGPAHGFSAVAGVGASWTRGTGEVGLFAELGFLLARAGRDQMVLSLDDQGRPIYDPATLTYARVEQRREFELTTAFLNLGLVYQP